MYAHIAGLCQLYLLLSIQQQPQRQFIMVSILILAIQAQHLPGEDATLLPLPSYGCGHDREILHPGNAAKCISVGSDELQ